MSQSSSVQVLASAAAVTVACVSSPALADGGLLARDQEAIRSGGAVVGDDEGRALEAPPAGAAQAAEESLTLPFSISPRVNGATAFARAVAGYDGAEHAFVARSAAEARVLGFLSLRLDYQHGPGMGPDDRLGVGARAQLLRAEDHGVDGGIGIFYQPNDFREEGHVAAALLVGRYFGRLGVFANALFGADPEADDAALEGRLSALYRASDSVRVGWDNRFRYNLSNDKKREGTLARDWELQSVPSVTYCLDFVSFVAEVGLSALQQTGPFATAEAETTTRAGFMALAGAGGAF